MIYAIIFLFGLILGAYLAIVGLFYMDNVDRRAIAGIYPSDGRPIPADCAYLEP